MGLIRKTLAVGKFAIGVPPGVGPKFYSNGEAIRRQANKQTRILREIANNSEPQQYFDDSQSMPYRHERQCPACAENILAEASLCRFCHTSVTPIPSTSFGTANVGNGPVANNPIAIKMTTCPNCATSIAAAAKICKNCRIDL